MFGDWQSKGTVFAAREPDGGGTWPIDVFSLNPTDGERPGKFLLGFGRDQQGELYILTTDTQTPDRQTGTVHRLVPSAAQS